MVVLEKNFKNMWSYTALAIEPGLRRAPTVHRFARYAATGETMVNPVWTTFKIVGWDDTGENKNFKSYSWRHRNDYISIKMYFT